MQCSSTFCEKLLRKWSFPSIREISGLKGGIPARKAAFESWLDPANFDADGRQRTALAR